MSSQWSGFVIEIAVQARLWAKKQPRISFVVASAQRLTVPFAVRMSLRTSFLAVCLLGTLSVGCQNYRDQLNRGQGYYERNQYELALAVWRNLEEDQGSLTPAEVVRYCYLRGMTDFRLGYRADARYWLGLAKAGELKKQGILEPEEMARLEETIKDLDADVYGTTGDAEKQPVTPVKSKPASPAPQGASPPSEAPGADASGDASIGGGSVGAGLSVETK